MNLSTHEPRVGLTSLLGLWPREKPRQQVSLGETRVYEALARDLPEGWAAWHSLRLRSRQKGHFAEADFVIADPGRPSLLILEVKSGNVEQKDGRWFQNGQPLDSAPLDQAFSFRRLLIERLKEKNVQSPTMGAAVCFPDVAFDRQPRADDLAGLVIGKQELGYLSLALPPLMKLAVPEPWQVESQWLRTIHELWGETWVPDPCLGTRVEWDEARRIRLDKEQACRLAEIEENRRVLIEGPAGTGKTLLAMETALREARKGNLVLLLCYTEALAGCLRERILDPAVTVAPIKKFAAGLLGEMPQAGRDDRSPEYWRSVTLRAAVDGRKVEPWDAVIVDEGQDFSEEDWLFVESCGGNQGKLWAFADEVQAFWPDRSMPDDTFNSFFKLRLQRPYRCHPAIQHLSDCYAGRCERDPGLLKCAAEEGVIRVITSSEARLQKQIGKEINRLLSERLRPEQIAVLSLRGRAESQSVVHAKRVGDHVPVPATDPEAGSRLVCDTFLRFKGLERPAIIVTDLRLVGGQYEKRMHIATSRAVSLLRIVGAEREIRKDAILTGLD